MATAGDPRLERAREAAGGERDVRPLVGAASAGVPLWVMGIGLALLAVLLFSALEARRRTASAPPVRPRDDTATAATQPPPTLAIPPVPAPPPTPVATPTLAPPPPPPRAAPQLPQPRVVHLPSPTQPPAAPARPSAGDSVIVLDTSEDATPSDTPTPNPRNPTLPFNLAEGVAPNTTPARASVLRNRPTTVVQGTLIPAVLESAFDSNRPGPSRAIVSRDVRGFDGSRVLIPRGSRLIGDYRAQLQPGQNRATITWSRLIRPDGVTIAIGSPAADTLGRAGIRGKVNSHFLEKLGVAVLQTSLEVGANLATRIGNNSNQVVLALPGAGQTLIQPFGFNQQLVPTLRIKQGTSISVFVARDLDFTGVEAQK